MLFADENSTFPPKLKTENSSGAKKNPQMHASHFMVNIINGFICFNQIFLYFSIF